MNSMNKWTWLGPVVGALLFASPAVWAQPLEVPDPAGVAQEVTVEVERLVTEVAAQDPELAAEIERQHELCLQDLSDGRLDDAELTQDIENLRDVHQEVVGRVLQSELEAQITQALNSGNTELAEQLRTALTTWQGGEELGGPQGETINRTEARAIFDRAYQEALANDPEGAERMKTMFEAAERGDFTRPTPEMMERMHAEMERYLTERPEMGDYARAEWDRFVDLGPDRGDRYSPTDSPEHAREAFDRWAAEGHSAEEITRAQEMYREWESRTVEGTEFERYYEAPERNYDTVLEQQVILQQEQQPPSEVFVRTDPEGEVFRHSDLTCHNHGSSLPDNC